MHISIHQSLRETSTVRLFILATFWWSWSICSTRAASTSYSLVPSSTLKEYQWCAWLQGASLLTKCSEYILLCRYISVVPLVWCLPFETAALTGRLPSMLLSVNTLQVLFLKILNILSLQHLFPLFLLWHHLVELAVQRLPQYFWHPFLLLRVVCEKLRGWIGVLFFVDLGGKGYGGYVHRYVLPVERAAEWTRPGITRRGPHYAQVSQGALHVRRRREETTWCSSLWLRTQGCNLSLTSYVFNKVWRFNEPA